MEDEGISNSKKYFLLKFLEDIKILYKRFKFIFVLVFIYKILIKIPSILIKKNKYNKNFKLEINKLL